VLYFLVHLQRVSFNLVFFLAATGWISNRRLLYLFGVRSPFEKRCQKLMKVVETDVTVNLYQWGIHNIAILKTPTFFKRR